MNPVYGEGNALFVDAFAKFDLREMLCQRKFAVSGNANVKNWLNSIELTEQETRGCSCMDWTNP